MVKFKDIKYHKSKREIDKDMENNYIRVELNNLKITEAEIKWKALREKLINEEKHLKKKYQGKMERNDPIQSAKVSDKTLGERRKKNSQLQCPLLLEWKLFLMIQKIILKKSEDPPKTFRIYRSQSGDTERFQQATS